LSKRQTEKKREKKTAALTKGATSVIGTQDNKTENKAERGGGSKKSTINRGWGKNLERGKRRLGKRQTPKDPAPKRER